METLVDQVIDQLKEKINNFEFERYIMQIKFNDKLSKPDYVVFNATNEIISRYIQTKYSDTISDIFKLLTGVKPQILITSKNRSAVGAIKKIEQKPKNTILNINFNFDNFIVGESNQFAFNYAKIIAQNPGVSFNPFFIYGPSGLGKTHLLQSIGNYCIDKNYSVICVTSDQFISDFVFHTKNNSMAKFTEKYRNCDLLLIDDIQAIGSAEKTQNELFHTFNELTNKKKQIVFTSDVPPKNLKGFEERLISRFEMGLVANIIPPEFDTKILIIKQKCKLNNINLGKDVIEYIATNMGDNIREIEGAINTLNALSSIIKIDINLDFAKTSLQDYIKEKTKENITIEEIIEIVSKDLNIKPSDIKSKSRSKNIVSARRISIFLIKNLTANSTSQIANYFGMKDHSAISHNIKKINQIISNDDYLKTKVEELKNKITKGEKS